MADGARPSRVGESVESGGADGGDLRGGGEAAPWLVPVDACHRGLLPGWLSPHIYCTRAWTAGAVCFQPMCGGRELAAGTKFPAGAFRCGLPATSYCVEVGAGHGRTVALHTLPRTHFEYHAASLSLRLCTAFSDAAMQPGPTITWTSVSYRDYT
jgi:hypothetical protein